MSIKRQGSEDHYDQKQPNLFFHANPRMSEVRGFNTWRRTEECTPGSLWNRSHCKCWSGALYSLCALGDAFGCFAVKELLKLLTAKAAKNFRKVRKEQRTTSTAKLQHYRNVARKPGFRVIESKLSSSRMLPEIENLLRLQEADKHIRRLQDEIAELPKRVAAIEHKLADTKAKLEKAQAAVKADEATRRKYDTTISDLRGKISKYRDQSLDVKTNDQYKALLHEIQFAEKDIAATEDKILELMLNADARDKEVKAAQADLKAETAEIEKEKAQARERTAEDEKQLAEWRAKRDQMRAGVNEDLLRHYERVSKFRGSGISEVKDHKCMACQVMLRPQTYNDVRTGQQTVVCDSCQRILYYNPAEEMQKLEPEHKRARRHHPKIDAPQAWYYRAGVRRCRRSFYLSGERARPIQPARLRHAHRPPRRRHPHSRRRLPTGISGGHYRRHSPQRKLDRKRYGKLGHRDAHDGARFAAHRS